MLLLPWTFIGLLGVLSETANDILCLMLQALSEAAMTKLGQSFKSTQITLPLKANS